MRVRRCKSRDERLRTAGVVAEEGDGVLMVLCSLEQNEKKNWEKEEPQSLNQRRFRHVERERKSEEMICAADRREREVLARESWSVSIWTLAKFTQDDTVSLDLHLHEPNWSPWACNNFLFLVQQCQRTKTKQLLDPWLFGPSVSLLYYTSDSALHLLDSSFSLLDLGLSLNFFYIFYDKKLWNQENLLDLLSWF